MQGLVQEQLQAQQERKNYAIVTILEVSGSTPRTNGKMIVYENGLSKGTIGGGSAEQNAKKDATELIQSGENALRQYDILNHSGVRTGTIRVLIEVYRTAPLLVMCGAGHVARSLVQVAKLVGFDVLLVDDRPMEIIADTVKLADRFVPIQSFENDIRTLETEKGAYYVIATYSHDTDGEALAAVLEKDSAYVGMVGSRHKIDLLFSRLRERGYSQEQLAKIFTPIGLDIGGETPPEIAVGIMAEILSVRYGKAVK